MNVRRHRRFVAWVGGMLAAALLVVAAAAQTPAPATPSPAGRGLIWSIERDGRTSWLVGSLHLLTRDAYPLPAALDAAFAQADVLVEEADPEELKAPATAMQLLAKATYPAGVTLQSQVSAATFEQIATRAARVGLPIGQLQSFKPWMVALTLVGLELQRGGFDPELGLDRHFLERAPAEGKAVRTLEAAVEQIEFLERLSPQLQGELVSATFEGADTELEQVRTIAAAWRAGDTAPIERLLVGGIKGADAVVYDTLLVGRNRRWLPKLESCFATSRCFVVVGAAHLVGPDGLVTMLTQRGYTVTQR